MTRAERLRRTACGALAAIGMLAGATSAQERPDRSRPPAIGPAPALRLPVVQKRALRNGIPVWVIENHEVPLVQVNLLVLAGSSDDPEGKYGVAGLAAAMLDEGAGTRSSLEIADEVEFLGASLTAASSFDASAVRLSVPVSRLAPALDVMADVVIRPSFPESDLERVRRERLTSLLQARDDAESIAPLAFQRLVFGPAHRYGTSGTGSEASLARLSREDLREFHDRWYRPAHARVIVVGDITADEAVARLSDVFGSWSDGSSVARRAPVPEAPQVGATRIYLVDHPDAAQSQIRIGRVGVPRSTPEFFPLEVLNTVLGGSFTSRLNQNLRERNQFTYGAFSRFDMRLSAGPFVAAAGVQTDKTAEALREFMVELRAVAAPVPDEELAQARNFIALGLPSEFETARAISVRFEEMIAYGLPETYFQDYVENVRAVTTAAVQAAARAHLDTSRMVIVVVGDRRTVEPALRALDLAPLTVMSVEEALGL